MRIKNIFRGSVCKASMGVVIGIFMGFAGCSDEKELALPSVKDNVYTSSNLELYYGENEMPGKWVKMSVVSTDAASSGVNKTVALMFGQTLELSSLPGVGLTGSLPGPGVTPGNAELTLPVALIAGDGEYKFSGSGNTDYLTFDYSGKMAGEKLTFQFKNCQLKVQAYAGKVFIPAPLKESGMTYTSMPFHLVWELDPAIGVDIPLTQILQMLATAPIVPVYNNTAYSSISRLFDSAIRTIAMTTSGDMPVMYISTVGGAAHIATTNPNMLQYVVAPGGIKLFVNPLSVMGVFLTATSNNKDNVGFDFDKLLSRASAGDESDYAGAVEPAFTKELVIAMITALAPQLRDGIPLSVTQTATGSDIYFDTDTSVQFLSVLLQSLMNEPLIMRALQKYMAEISIPGVTPAQLSALLQALPTYLEHTTRLEIGLSLVESRLF